MTDQSPHPPGPLPIPTARWYADPEGNGSVWTVRRQCRRIINGLDLPEAATLDELVAKVGEASDLRLRAAPYDLGSRISGLTLIGDGEGVILYQARATPYHRLGIVGHELGHCALRHRLKPQAAVEVARLMASLTDPDRMAAHLTVGVHTRHEGYGVDAELGAEEFGTQLAMRFPLLAIDGPTTAVDRLSPSLEHRRGRT